MVDNAWNDTILVHIHYTDIIAFNLYISGLQDNKAVNVVERNVQKDQGC